MFLVGWHKVWALSFSVFAGVLVSTPLVFAAGSSQADAVDGVIKNTEQHFLEKNRKATPQADYLPKGQRSDEASLSASDSDDPGFVLKNFIIVGAEHLSSQRLRSCGAGFRGRSLLVSDLVKIADCMTDVYVKAGFSLSRVVVPPQDITGGVVRFQAIEGYIAGFEIKGQGHERFPVASYLDVLLKERPLRQSHLERQLMLLNDLPGLMVEDTSLEEVGKLTGAFKLVVHVTTWRLWSQSEIDNRGTKAVGPLQTYQSVYLNSPFGHGGSLGFSYSSIPDSSDELNFARLSLDLPLNGEGLGLSGFVSASETRPGDERTSSNTRYRNLNGGLSLTYAWAREREFSAWFGAGVWASTKVNENDNGRFVRDELRGVHINGQFDFQDRFNGENSVFVTLRQGLDVGGASRAGDPLLSNSDGDGVFTKLYMDLVRYQSIDDHWSFKLDLAAQFSNRGLLSSEEFYIGGSRFGRGFESGALSGDSGFGAAFELAYYTPLDFAFLNGAKIYGFADVAGILEDGFAEQDGAIVASAGGGVRFFLDYDIKAEFELAFALEDDYLTDVDDHEFVFRLSRSVKLQDLSVNSYLNSLPLVRR